MAYNRIQAARILNKAELALFHDSLASALDAHDETRLASLVKRARTFRDKARDLLRRQKLATRVRTGSKTGTGGDANRRTQSKARLLDEVLARFESRLARMRRAGKPRGAAKRTAAAVLKRAVAKKRAASAQPAAQGVAGMRSPKAPAELPIARKSATGAPAPAARLQQKQFQQSGTRAILGHVGASGRRAQARRDKR